MKIRNAEIKDANDIVRLLHQVLEVHAAIRPDIFLSGTTKYDIAKVTELICDDNRRSYVAENDEGAVVGYALCEIQEQKDPNKVPMRMLFVDDICVDETERGKHTGTLLFDRIKEEAKRLGCYEVTLNVWEGNVPAKAFYGKMGMKPKEIRMELILGKDNNDGTV